ncbi:hypothetical protein HDU78_009752 [Chytriomyces hyalinus]|nr:hypothetical protein HDU78_009752 [Chytriomyces hyalinus]
MTSAQKTTRLLLGFDTFDYQAMKIRICNKVNGISNIDKFYEPDETKPKPDLTKRQIPSKINLLEAQQKAMESLEDRITKMKSWKSLRKKTLRTQMALCSLCQGKKHQRLQKCLDLEGEKCKLILLYKQKIYKIEDEVKQAIKFKNKLNGLKQSEALAVKTLKSEKWLDASLSHHWSKEKLFQTIMDKLATMTKQMRLESKMTEMMNKGKDLSDGDYTLDELVEASSNYWGMIKVAYLNAIMNEGHYMEAIARIKEKLSEHLTTGPKGDIWQQFFNHIAKDHDNKSIQSGYREKKS